MISFLAIKIKIFKNKLKWLKYLNKLSKNNKSLKKKKMWKKITKKYNKKYKNFKIISLLRFLIFQLLIKKMVKLKMNKILNKSQPVFKKKRLKINKNKIKKI